MVAEKVHADAELDEKEMGSKVAQMGGKAKASNGEENGLAAWKGGSRRRRARKSKGKSLRRKKMTMKQRQQQQRQQRQQRRRR
jgi:hypothetical protein